MTTNTIAVDNCPAGSVLVCSCPIGSYSVGNCPDITDCSLFFRSGEQDTATLGLPQWQLSSTRKYTFNESNRNRLIRQKYILTFMCYFLCIIGWIFFYRCHPSKTPGTFRKSRKCVKLYLVARQIKP